MLQFDSYLGSCGSLGALGVLCFHCVHPFRPWSTERRASASGLRGQTGTGRVFRRDPAVACKRSDQLSPTHAYDCIAFRSSTILCTCTCAKCDACAVSRTASATLISAQCMTRWLSGLHGAGARGLMTQRAPLLRRTVQKTKPEAASAQKQHIDPLMQPQRSAARREQSPLRAGAARRPAARR